MSDRTHQVEKELVDGVARDARGEWQPAELEKPAPIFAWPPRPIPKCLLVRFSTSYSIGISSAITGKMTFHSTSGSARTMMDPRNHTPVCWQSGGWCTISEWVAPG